MVRSRRLDKKITVQRSIETQDAYGGAISSWDTYVICWAEVLPTTGRETYTAQQFHSERVVLFRVAYDSETKDIIPKDRILYDARTFDIIVPPVNEEGLNRYLLLTCTENV